MRLRNDRPAVDRSAMSKQYYVYMVTNKYNTVLYVGVTNDLQRRVYEHREKQVSGFTRKYNVGKLVWYEIHENPESAIMREKQIKDYSRAKKIALIEADNPEYTDLYENIILTVTPDTGHSEERSDVGISSWVA